MKCRTRGRYEEKATSCYRNNQSDIGKVELEYIIRDHSMEKFEEQRDLTNRRCANATYDVPRIECTIYDEYYNMYEILKDDMTSG